MKRDALWLGDRREEELLQEIRRIYTDALHTALEKQKRFFKKIEDIESGKYKPPQYYVQRGTVKKWRQGFVREALRQEQVIQGIMNVLNKAGKEASALMTPYLVDIYRYNREETVRMLQGEIQEGYGITPNFAMYDPRKIRILLEEKQPPFSKIAYKNMGKNIAVRHRLQSEFAQAVILGEGIVKMRRRVAKCTGQLIWQARRVARTERTRIQGQARWETAQEASDMGIGIYNEWIARMVNTRDTHAAMNGQKRMQGEPFQSPSGALLMYPGDPSAPPEEVINCQCQITSRVLLPGEKLVDEKVVKGLPDGGNASLAFGYKELTMRDVDANMDVEIPKEAQRTVNRVSKAVSKDFPIVDQYLNGIMFGENEEGNPATVYVNMKDGYFRQVIALNASMWSDYEVLKEFVRKEAESGKHVFTYDVGSIPAHEYGHAILNALVAKRLNIQPNTLMSSFQMQAFPVVMDEIYSYIQVTYGHRAHELGSKRTLDSIGELISESFSSYYAGNRAKLSIEIVDYFKKECK